MVANANEASTQPAPMKSPRTGPLSLSPGGKYLSAATRGGSKPLPASGVGLQRPRRQAVRSVPRLRSRASAFVHKDRARPRTCFALRSCARRTRRRTACSTRWSTRSTKARTDTRGEEVERSRDGRSRVPQGRHASGRVRPRRRRRRCRLRRHRCYRPRPRPRRVQWRLRLHWRRGARLSPSARWRAAPPGGGRRCTLHRRTLHAAPGPQPARAAARASRAHASAHAASVSRTRRRRRRRRRVCLRPASTAQRGPASPRAAGRQRRRQLERPRSKGAVGGSRLARRRALGAHALAPPRPCRMALSSHLGAPPSAGATRGPHVHCTSVDGVWGSI